MQRSPATLKVGVAFTGGSNEGLVTSFMNFAAGFGGSLDLKHVASNQNVQALTYMRNLIHSDRVTPQAATGWQDSDVEKAYLVGQTPFAVNWQYVFAEAQATAAVKGKTAWIPFPSPSGSKSALGGEDLAVNSHSQHADAAYKFIQYLTSTGVQIDRALSAGDPPAVRSAYTDRLFSRASYFKEEQKVFAVATPRPVTPFYPQVSTVLQTELNAALTNQASPTQALTAAQQQINQIVGTG
jgi:multiple sugar transport system substrate-binding protein